MVCRDKGHFPSIQKYPGSIPRTKKQQREKKKKGGGGEVQRIGQMPLMSAFNSKTKEAEASEFL